MRDFARTGQVEGRVEDIYATRSFAVYDSPGGARLHGLVFRQEVLPGINQSTCGFTSDRHEAPSPDCTCGFYCYDDESPKIWSPIKSNLPTNTVDAVVRISGRVVVHSTGLRAQNIEIVAFAIPKYSTDVSAERLSQKFPGVPIFDSLKEAYAEFPKTPVERSAEKAKRGFKRTLIDFLPTLLVSLLIIAAALLSAPVYTGVKALFEIPVLMGFVMLMTASILVFNLNLTTFSIQSTATRALSVYVFLWSGLTFGISLIAGLVALFLSDAGAQAALGFAAAVATLGAIFLPFVCQVSLCVLLFQTCTRGLFKWNDFRHPNFELPARVL